MPSSDQLADLRGARVTVFGLGREGLDLVRFLTGERARVLATDQKDAAQLGAMLAQLSDLDVRYSLGGHPLETVLDADVLFVSPGMDPRTPVLAEARRRGVPVASATQLFFARCAGTIVGITGSSGKSTTTALVGEMLPSLGKPVVVGGNIGEPLLHRLPLISADTLVVMELSSFQLESLDRSPSVAAITNITPNHLDRHESMEAYVAAKERILRFQRPCDFAILNADDPHSAGLETHGSVAWFSLKRTVNGAYLHGSEVVIAGASAPRPICRADDLRLRGRHNLANALTAATVAATVGVSPEDIAAVLREFRGLPHRLQHVGQVRDISFVDDSIATSPERSIAAIESFSEPLVLLAGGRDKHLPMDDWARLIRRRVSSVVLFGEAAPLIAEALDRSGYPRDQVRSVQTIRGAIESALDVAPRGAVVLLSPGGTSYDMYSDFAERGDAFAAEVRDLTRSVT